MGGDPITSAIVSTVVGQVAGKVLGGDKEASKARKANEAASAATAAAADMDMNRKNMRKPDVGAITNSTMLSAQGGNLSTLLTGPRGSSIGMGNLNRNTLLGM